MHSLPRAFDRSGGCAHPPRVAHDPPPVGVREDGIADFLGHIVGNGVLGQIANIAPVYTAHYGAFEYPRPITSRSRGPTDLDEAHRGSAGCMALPPGVIMCMAVLPGVIICVVVLGQREIGDDIIIRVVVFGQRGIGNRPGTRIGHRYHPRSTIRARGRSRKLWRDRTVYGLLLDTPAPPVPPGHVVRRAKRPAWRACPVRPPWETLADMAVTHPQAFGRRPSLGDRRLQESAPPGCPAGQT